ncbi:MAG: hypothetical protein RTV41_07490 [Candidatus Thorarchaeota archaeon]
MGFLLLALLVEYNRKSGLAIIEVNVLHGGIPQPKIEQKIRDIFIRVTEKNLERLLAVPKSGIFVCPVCDAQYSLRVLKATEDGKIECQNCGRFIDFLTPEELESLDE